MSTDTGDRSADRQRPNSVLIAKREERGWRSRKRAARELHVIWRANHGQFGAAPDVESLEKALYRHETGRTQVRDDAYRRLYCLAYEASPHELFGTLDQESVPDDGMFSLRSHKFIAAHLTPAHADALRAKLKFMPVLDQWLRCERVDYASPSVGGQCTLYLWPFGSLIFHLAEDVTMSSLADMAIWRCRSYEDNLSWATEELGKLLPSGPDASYILSTYWMREPAWLGEALDTALRILCIPKTLLERDLDAPDALDRALLVERSLLSQGFTHPGLHPFGIKGISIGYASWSGVVYHPVAEHRCLAEDELVAVELAAQALWTYCTYVNSEVEQGRDPAVPADYGWRFLRGVRSLLINPRPQETEQHRAMRNAILETSGLDTLLSHAIEVLRETEGLR